MILLTLDFTNLTNFNFYSYKPLLLLIVMTQKKSTPKKAPKRAQRVERVERIEHSAPKDNKNVPDRLLMMMMKKVTEEVKKRGEATEINWPIHHKKLRRRNERRRLKGRFSFKSVDFFTNILLIEIMIANPLRVLRKEKSQFW